MKKNNSEISRRQFIVSGAVAFGAMAAIGAGVKYLQKPADSGDLLLRPPGAVSESDFIYGCIKCGLCVQICPIQAIKLSGINEALAYGTPYVDVRNQACDFSCDSLQCAETCPTAVLNFKQFKTVGEKAIEKYYDEHDAKEEGFNPFKTQIVAMKEAVKMGVAKLKPETCLAVKGKGFKGTPRGKDFKGINRTPNGGTRGATPLSTKNYDREICDLCVTECPIGESAIVLEVVESNGSKSCKPKVLEACTGCGVCVMVCPTEPGSMFIEPSKSENYV